MRKQSSILEDQQRYRRVVAQEEDVDEDVEELVSVVDHHPSNDEAIPMEEWDEDEFFGKRNNNKKESMSSSSCMVRLHLLRLVLLVATVLLLATTGLIGYARLVYWFTSSNSGSYLSAAGGDGSTAAWDAAAAAASTANTSKDDNDSDDLATEYAAVADVETVTAVAQDDDDYGSNDNDNGDNEDFAVGLVSVAASEFLAEQMQDLGLPVATSKTTDFIYQPSSSSSSYNNNDGGDEDLLQQLRYCRMLKGKRLNLVHPDVDEEGKSGSDGGGLYTDALLPAKSKDGGFSLAYHCEGEEYKTFAGVLHLYADNVSEAKIRQEEEQSQQQQEQRFDELPPPTSSYWWGRRQVPMPGANRSLLVMGNSHTRQIFGQLLCQYWHLITSLTNVSPHTSDNTLVLHLGSINSTVYFIANSALFYSTEWPMLLEHRFSVDKIRDAFKEGSGPLPPALHVSALDAIVLGDFNGFAERVQNGFATAVRDDIQYYFEHDHLELEFDESALDFEHVDAPNVSQVAEVFTGPIIRMSGFAEYMQNTALDERDWVESHSSIGGGGCTTSATIRGGGDRKNDGGGLRDNIVYLDGRKYVDDLGLECGGDNGDPLNRCHETGDSISENMREPKNMHRCQGSMGGHPDLVAWDVVEMLYALLLQEK